MCRTHYNLYTKDQVETLLGKWECQEPVPKRGTRLVIAWPGRSDLDVDIVEVEPTNLPATYGGKLFKVTYSSRAGRAFEHNVQDAHVRSFCEHMVKINRQEVLLKHAIAA